MLGGYELGCSQAVTALRKRGHEVHVLTSISQEAEGDENGIRRQLRLTTLYNYAEFERLSADAKQQMIIEANFVNSFNAQILAEAIGELQPDVAYLWNLVGLGGLALVACLEYVGLPWVWHLMDAVPLFLCSSGTANVAHETVVSSLAREFGQCERGRFIVCSQRVRDEITAAGVPLPGTVHLIPNWVTGEVRGPRMDFYRHGHLKVITAGQLGQHKGTDIVIETAAALRDRGFGEYSIDIYGIGDDYNFRGLAAASGVDDVVRFHGDRTHEELLELYASYDIFVFPTWNREPFGFAPLEAASRGCVPLITADSGIGEWLVGGVHCLKAKRDPVDFASVLGAVIEGQVDVGDVGRRGQAVVARDFHLDSIAPAIEGVLADATADRAPRRLEPREFARIVLLGESMARVLLYEQSA
jgi:glycogen(starch) synthase